jgi:hypothetical protein
VHDGVRGIQKPIAEDTPSCERQLQRGGVDGISELVREPGGPSPSGR